MQQEDPEAISPISIFYSYASEDETDQATLEKYLSSLRQRGLITDWHRRKIAPGRDQEQEINNQLITAQIILLLLSADYLASNYHSNIEMPRALQRHANGEARVIPILLRPCDWENSPLGNLSPLPTTYKPISQSQDRDAAFLDVARGIRTVVDALIGRSLSIAIRSRQEQELSTSSKRPRNYIPFPRNPLFQPRPGEFERLDQMLISSGMQQRPLRIGLIGMIGMGGVGKTQLAVELAYRCQRYFPSGVFWVTATGITTFEWQRHLAELAGITEYLPHNDDVSSPENEARRARHFCRYLACHADALVILDNVEDPTLVMSTLPSLAGGEVACTILYTSRKRFAPPGVTIHAVEKLPEEGALRLLLETTRPSLLTEVLAGSQHAEAKAARAICDGVGYLPLAIVHLQGSLARDPLLTLVRLAEVLKERGALEVAKKHYLDAAPLFATFRLSWEQMHDEGAQRLFKLASYFQEATPVPLWLLGLAAGLGESGDIFEPLGEGCLQLQELSLLEELSAGQVRLHPLVHAFGRRLVAEDSDKGKTLLQEAGERLASEFADMNKLEHRALHEGYWRCLEQIRAAREYAELVETDQAERLGRIERWLARESYLLGDGEWWPKPVLGLFYQQFFNRSVEEGYPPPMGETPTRWLRQVGQVGAEDRSLLRVFAGHAGEVWSVAFSPDGRQVLTGSADRTARLWETGSGKLLVMLQGHMGDVTSVAFSPDGKQILTGSLDQTARLWEMASGKLLVTLQGHADAVTSVACSPDGKQVLTGSWDQTARVWETASGRVLSILEGHVGWVRSVAFSPDGKQVLTGSDDQTARLWETTSGRMLTTLEGHTGWVKSIAFSSNGKQVLTGSADRTARLWETASGKLLAILEGHTGGVGSVVFSSDGSRVLTGSSDNTARVWETASGKLLAILEGHTSAVTSVMFSSDGSRVLTGSRDSIARLWETVSGKLLVTLEGHTLDVMSVVFSSDGSRVLTRSWDNTARLWETASGKLLAILEGHTGGVESVAFSPDGCLSITCDVHGRVLLWRASEPGMGSLLGMYVATYEVGAVHWQDNTHVIVVDKGGPRFRPHFYRLKLEGM